MSEATIGHKKEKDSISSMRLKVVLKYKPESGNFIWLVKKSSNARVGDVAGVVDPSGYRLIRVDGKLYRACRLAWFYVTGAWPLRQIDHINGDSADDSWSNLRSASNSQNNMNKGVRKDSRSQLKGAVWCSRESKWSARITANGKTKILGAFDNPVDAHLAYVRASKNLHGEFARSK